MKSFAPSVALVLVSFHFLLKSVVANFIAMMRSIGVIGNVLEGCDGQKREGNNNWGRPIFPSSLLGLLLVFQCHWLPVSFLLAPGPDSPGGGRGGSFPS